MAVTKSPAKRKVRSEQFKVRWTPAAAAGSEVAALLNIPAGWRVKSVSGDLITASDAAGTATVGDGGAVNRFSLTTDKAANGALGHFQGLGTGLDLGGYLYIADDTVDVDYTANGGETIAPVMDFVITIEQEYGAGKPN